MIKQRYWIVGLSKANLIHIKAMMRAIRDSPLFADASDKGVTDYFRTFSKATENDLEFIARVTSCSISNSLTAALVSN